MSLRLHDTATRSVRDFVPLTPGRVTMYLCGATVQGAPHLGHVRSAVIFDVLTRWLRARAAAEGDDLDVILCRNVTDIDDKILRVAADERVPWWRVASRNERLFSAAYDVLGCLPPSIEPRATGHVPQMIELMRRLLDAGHAYEAEGSVYFSVRSFAGYGALSGQDPAHMQQGETDAGGKRDPLDFALWKAAKPGEPTWPTPWGRGRPGWHLECSAMATTYLGATFDIHGGGLDLLFPHHENERAQSTAAGDGFARYWMHNGLLTVDGEKMSKSLGNSLLVSELVRAARPVELRYYLTAAHYRSTLDFTGSSLSDAAAAYRRIEGFVRRAAEIAGAGPADPGAADVQTPAIPPDFAAAMDDDLGVPQALAVVHTRVREGNAALADGDKPAVAAHSAAVRAMLSVLGLDPVTQWPQDDGNAGLRDVVDALVSVALEQRAAARGRKDFQAADAIRDRLGEIGVAVEDTPAGPRWELKGRS